MIEFLKRNYPKYGAKYCSIKLGCKQSRVRIKASNLGISREKNSKTKICSKCFQEKPINEYSPHLTGRFGIYPSCKKCNSKKELLRRSLNPEMRLIHNLRTRIAMAIKKNVKSGKSLDLLGCSIDFLKKYLSDRFQLGMTWDNYGVWHIDHIRPCSSFNLSDVNQQRICFHYSNLQPLWKRDNLSKGSKCN